jgi:hypothetical protein
VVGLAGNFPGEEGVELSPGPVEEVAEQNGEEGKTEGNDEEAHLEYDDQELVKATESEGLHADATLLVEGGEDGAAAGGAEVEEAGELSFRGSGNEVGVWHLS